MEENFTIPPTRAAKRADDFILPNNPQIKGEATQILKGVGLALIKPKFYKVDTDAVALEDDSLDSSGTGNLLGMPIFDAITFQKLTVATVNQSDVNEISQNQIGVDLVLTTALITANKPKNIVLTKVQGRNGTVKEYVSDDDYQISIRGALVGKYSNKRPEQEFNLLKQYCDINLEINVISNFLNDLGIYTIVITNFTYTQREGTRNVVDFEIQCLQETPFEIKTNA